MAVGNGNVPTGILVMPKQPKAKVLFIFLCLPIIQNLSMKNSKNTAPLPPSGKNPGKKTPFDLATLFFNQKLLALSCRAHNHIKGPLARRRRFSHQRQSHDNRA